MAMCTAAAMAQQQPDRLPVVIDLQGVSLAQVVHLVYKEISPSSYVMAPDLVADQRAVSLRWTGDPARLPGFHQWLRLSVLHVSVSGQELTAAGTVADFHGIPFSFYSQSLLRSCEIKTKCKTKIIYLP